MVVRQALAAAVVQLQWGLETATPNLARDFLVPRPRLCLRVAALQITWYGHRGELLGFSSVRLFFPPLSP